MRIGSLFSGAGGLDMAVEQVFGGHTVWQCEMDKAASKVLAYRWGWRDVPNLGDITKVEWYEVPEIDVLCGGFPCQDVSAAGKRAGIQDGTRSGLWAVFADIIDILRPPIVVIENVRGLLSATAHRAVESDDAVVGDRSDQPVLRALRAVLGDLSDLGYDAVWATVAAASVGAPHRRERVFIVASDTAVGGWDARQSESEGQRRQPVVGPSGDRTDSVDLLPTPTAQAAKHGAESRFGGGNGDVSNLWQIAHLLPKPESQEGNMLPTPRATDGTDGPVTNCPSVQAICDGSAGRSPRLSEMAAGGLFGDEPGVALLPTPNTQDGLPGDGGGEDALVVALNGDGVAVDVCGAENSHSSYVPAELAGTKYQLLPTPRTTDTNGAGHHGDGGMDLRTTVTLLPTPAAQDGNGGRRYSSEGHQTTLPGEVRLLPTPKAHDGIFGSTARTSGRPIENATHLQTIACLNPTSWGKYAPAIARWEQIVGPAPAPTEPNKNGNPRLSAAFSEWLMGWPAGWVTDPDIGISRNDQLRIVGNGVCTQQAIAALRYLVAVTA